MKRAALVLPTIMAAFLACGPVLAAYDESFADPVQEGRARTLQRELRCPLCQGQSLDESNAKIAQDLRILIRERIAAGQSDDQIKEFLVERYGDFILMSPPVRGDTAFLWFGPALVLLLGAGLVATIVMRANRRAAIEPETGDPELGDLPPGKPNA